MISINKKEKLVFQVAGFANILMMYENIKNIFLVVIIKKENSLIKNEFFLYIRKR